MKDAVVTVRLPRATRSRIEALARREGRSISQAVERLLERSLSSTGPAPEVPRPRGIRSLAGALRSARVPTLCEFREARGLLAASLARRSARLD